MGARVRMRVCASNLDRNRELNKFCEAQRSLRVHNFLDYTSSNPTCGAYPIISCRCRGFLRPLFPKHVGGHNCKPVNLNY